MKNQYYGDVNDYLKYGLLRCLGEGGLSVGVCWMLTPDDTRPDGKKTQYLQQPDRWRHRDPALFDALASTVGAGAVRSTSLAEDGVLLPGAIFCSEVVPDSRAGRAAWLAGASDALASAELIFFDPDNGIEVVSKPAGARDSSKYLYWNEIEGAWNRGASLLIFQHYARENRIAHTDRVMAKIRAIVPGASVTPLSSANVLFLLVGQPEHQDKIAAALDLAKQRWTGQVAFGD